jgi:hypothetical protein
MKSVLHKPFTKGEVSFEIQSVSGLSHEVIKQGRYLNSAGC